MHVHSAAVSLTMIPPRRGDVAASSFVATMALLFPSLFCDGLVLPGSTRGTTTSGRYCLQLRLLDDGVMQDVLGTVGAFYKESPVEAAFVTCGVKAASSDAIAQRAVERNTSNFAYKRNAAFIAYGGLYQGICQYYIFNELFPLIFGDGTDVATVAEKVLFDQLVLTPFLCLPIAYIVKASVFGYSIQEGLNRYISDAKKDLLWKYWALWTPTQCVTFSVVPEHLRIPFIAAVSFVWLILLSSITSRGDVIITTSNHDDDDNRFVDSSLVICYDNECLIMDKLSFVGPASLINEDGSSTGVQLQPRAKVSTENMNVGPSSLINEEDGSSIGVVVPAGVEVVSEGNAGEEQLEETEQ